MGAPVTEWSGIDARDYLNDLLGIGAILLWLLPAVHALVLYIFPLPWLLKLLATATAVGFVALSIPLQVGAIGWLVTNTSTLMMLPLYMVATFLPQVFCQLGIYAYFASLAPVPE